MRKANPLGESVDVGAEFQRIDSEKAAKVAGIEQRKNEKIGGLALNDAEKQRHQQAVADRDAAAAAINAGLTKVVNEQVGRSTDRIAAAQEALAKAIAAAKAAPGTAAAAAPPGQPGQPAPVVAAAAAIARGATAATGAFESGQVNRLGQAAPVNELVNLTRQLLDQSKKQTRAVENFEHDEFE
jgi:hypothetical protein